MFLNQDTLGSGLGLRVGRLLKGSEDLESGAVRVTVVTFASNLS